jgi:carboxyl-terminal processing protease
VQREGVEEPFDVTVVREEIVLPSVVTRMLGHGIAYLALRNFNNRTIPELAQSLRNLEEQGTQALILDLRGNPGGFLDVAVEAVSRFINEGPVLWWEDADGSRYPILVKQRPTYDWPLIVLVDQGSASAAEIMAGAIQDADRGILVGTRTFGKGSVQNVHQLRDGGSLRVTTAHWLTRDGRPIQGVGLEPDVIVEQKSDFPDFDFQLAFARRLLYNRITQHRSLPQE